MSTVLQIPSTPSVNPQTVSPFELDVQIAKALSLKAIGSFVLAPKNAMSDLSEFEGAGVYGIFIEQHPRYTHIPPDYPIYIGKAEPPGVRQGKKIKNQNKSLYLRLKEHARSLSQSAFELKHVRFCALTFSPQTLSLIGFHESELIAHFKPLWNSYIDGFGNHDPGAGRLGQQKSEWDTLHPGRPFAARLIGEAREIVAIEQKVAAYRTGQPLI